MAAAQTLEMDLAELAEWLEQRGRRLASLDFTPALKEGLRILKSYTFQNFDEGHDPAGVPWAGLRRPRRSGRTGEKPLRDTGLLMGSISTTGDGELGGNIEQMTPVSVAWGTNVPYAGFHQHGTQLIPARPFLGISEEMAGDIEDVFADFVQRAITER